MADDENLIPLAARQAPKTLEDFAGQPHLLGKGKMLRFNCFFQDAPKDVAAIALDNLCPEGHRSNRC